MGHTIVAHALYATNQKDYNLDNCFSVTGNAHSMTESDSDILIADHYYHHSLNRLDDIKCILHLESDDKFKILQFKMVHSKLHEQYPTRLDPMHCTENVKANPESSFLEILTIGYYEVLISTTEYNVPTYFLSDYIGGNLDVLQDVVCSTLGWTWDDARSDQFRSQMLEVNEPYFLWLADFDKNFNAVLNSEITLIVIDEWEKALLIAWLCVHYSIHPSDLRWNDYSFFENTIPSLIDQFKEYKNE
jgi:hypothetical protein